MNAREIALRLAVLKVLGDRVKDATAVTKAAAMAAMDVEDRKGAVLPDGSKVGTVTVAKGRESWTADPADPGLVAWAQANHPSEVEMVTTTRVRASYLRALTERAKAEGMAADPATGEEIPGVHAAVGDPYVMVRVSGDQAEAVARALASGAVSLPDFTAPPAIGEGT